MRVRRSFAALLAGTTLLVAGCADLLDGSTDTPEAPAVTTVPVGVNPRFATSPVVLGDSLTVNARDELEEVLPDAVIDALSGRTMVTASFSDAGIQRVTLLPGEVGRPWVVALGTNDAGYNNLTPEQLRDDLELLLVVLGPFRCVWWLLPHVTSPMPADAINRVEDFADDVREAIAERSCGGVLEWPDLVASDSGLLVGDGVHLTPQGAAAFAELVASLVPEWPNG